MRPTIALALIALTTSLAGCDFLDRVEGKSPHREYIERLALLEQRYAARNEPVEPVEPVAPVTVTAPVEVVAVQPVIAPPEPAPVVPVEQAAPVVPVVPVEPPAPAVCVAIFRVLSCGDNGEFIWL
jgi:hypothetical protein